MCKRLHIHAICLRTHIIKHMIISVICTNMRKGNSFFRKPTRPSLPLRKAPPLISVFSPQGRRGKPLLLVARNRYALRLADHQRSSPCCAGWDRLGIAVYSLQLIVYSLRLISWLFADNLQISCDFLGGFEEYV